MPIDKEMERADENLKWPTQLPGYIHEMAGLLTLTKVRTKPLP